MKLEDLGLAGGKRKTLVVLGAGASRGASFVTRRSGILPPLDLDFFQQVARLNNCSEAERLLAFVRDEYPNELRLSMEQFFSEADYTNRFHTELNVDKGGRVKRYEKALSWFHVTIAKILAASTAGECRYHDRLSELLAAGDSILSFNYDCIMDDSLKRKGGVRWDPQRNSYGVPARGEVNAWKTVSKGHPPATPIQLLKMHGSLNWENLGADITLRADARPSTAEGSIVPPSFFKRLTEEPFATIWKQARVAIRTSRIVIVIGYSVPATDLFSQSLFKVEAGSKGKREGLDALVLVNPDRDARRRFLDIVRNGLETSTKVLEYESIEVLHERLT